MAFLILLVPFASLVIIVFSLFIGGKVAALQKTDKNGNLKGFGIGSAVISVIIASLISGFMKGLLSGLAQNLLELVIFIVALFPIVRTYKPTPKQWAIMIGAVIIGLVLGYLITLASVSLIR